MPLPDVVVLDDWSGFALREPAWSRIEHRVRLRSETRHHDREDELVAALRGATVMVVMRERTPITASLLGKLPDLRLIVTTGARNAAIDIEAAADQGVLVAGTASDRYDAAELTWALILAAVRRIPEEAARVRRGDWTGGLGTSLDGRHLGVVGLGRLGGRVARIGLAFGMRVTAWSQHLTDERCIAVGVERAPTLAGLLEASDIVTIHVRLSDRTKGLIGVDQLRRMRPTAWLVNTSRGPVVDEAALLAALDTGTIAGAALDVFDVEPLPPDHPLRRHPRVLATPHLGYVADASWSSWFAEVVEDIEAWLDGAPIRLVPPS